MAHQVIIPAAGDSINSANVAQWHKKDGEHVNKGDTLVTLETDKVSNELEADVSGVLKVIVPEGEEVAIGTLIAEIEESAAGSAPAPAKAPVSSEESAPFAEPAVAVATPAATPVSSAPTSSGSAQVIEIIVPAAGDSINSANIGQWHKKHGEGVQKGDVLVTLETDKVSNELEAEVTGTLEIITPEGEEVAIGALIGKIKEGAVSAPVATASAPAPATPVSAPAPAAPVAPASPAPIPVEDGRTTRKKMTMLRRKIATHLVNAQQEAAILTTFNEVDMGPIMELRKSFQEDFVAKHGLKLGFMSFFIKAIVQGLKAVPQINGRIDGQEIVQNHFYDIGCAIGTEKGLIVPVLRDCDKMSFAEIEQSIIDYANKAREGQIQIEDLQGGCFTVSNGGVYGSLLSTPILNPPQSGILGMHTIQQRPMAVNGEVVIRPMMYLALSYDHRLVDGKEGVTFLIKIKEALENPTSLMLEL